MMMDDSLSEESLVTLNIMSDSQGTDSTLIASVVAAVLAQLKPNLPTNFNTTLVILPHWKGR
jgi:hypothetical protein